ncbi:DUF4175 family protein [Ascidiimonas aurantiaca]|uniref:DUF4175 family protein n=1 Tax=Ascidiimonas aurantiaca TaxID=1685432 RepID=UPI0030EF3A1A
MSNNVEIVKGKLQKFITRYHLNELIRGSIFFVAIGLMYLIVIAVLENFLWFDTTVRMWLFWITVAVEFILLLRFVLWPLASIFRLRKGIDVYKAAKIIGDHFKEVDDKLLNVIQLLEDKERSELLLASIEQKSKGISPVSFSKAVNFKVNAKYAVYAVIPILVIVFFWITGNISWFNDGYKRMVNYKEVYQRPAPFNFVLLNKELTAIENTSFTVLLQTDGKIVPENVKIAIEGQEFFMTHEGNGKWMYRIDRPVNSTNFFFTAGEFRSVLHRLQVLKVPKLVELQMKLDYPGYTKKRDEVILNTGNAVMPEGTHVLWKVKTYETDTVELIEKDSVVYFKKNEKAFVLEKQINNDLSYEITSSNEELKRYERLGYSFEVIKDAHPQIRVEERESALLNGSVDLSGFLSDDYGLTRLQLVYYNVNEPYNEIRVDLPFTKSALVEFDFRFPGALQLIPGNSYEFYFETWDNDEVNGNKSARSQVFLWNVLKASEKEDLRLDKQEKLLDNITDELQNIEKQQEALEEVNSLQKQKEKLTFSDERRLQELLKRQSLQNEMMKSFHKDLKKTLEDNDTENEKEEQYDRFLEERLERQEQERQKNEELLKELQELSDRMNKEELSMKLEQLAKQNQRNQRSLEQLVELTKRYYVTAKASKIQKELEEMASRQDSLAQKTASDELKDQQDLKDDFEKVSKELDKLLKDNEDLQKPLNITSDTKKREDIANEQKNAEESLKRENTDNQPESDRNKNQQSNEHQKRAARKMKEISDAMKSAMQSGASEGMQEDAEALRQILDNLVLFSFDQEQVMNRFGDNENEDVRLASKLRKQNELRSLFKHIDDSLFALSLRRPEISDVINKEITDVYYNIDKAIERMSDNQIFQGMANQQYVLTAANSLADFLSNVLDNMQQSMSGSSGQSGEGFQLPDIIQSQEQINQKMEQGMQQQGASQKPGEEGEKSNSSKDGEAKSKGGTAQEGDEEMNSRLFEIFKEQQQLRNALEEQLKNKRGSGISANEESLLRQMESIEQQLLERGFDESTLRRMSALKHQLMKLDKAVFQQGKMPERESRTNRDIFGNVFDEPTPEVKQYFNQTEILNRQVLPLRQSYKVKVKQYFDGNN